MRRLIFSLVLLVPLLVAAKPVPASCSVTPNPTAIQHDPYTSAYAYFTVNAFAPGSYSLYVHEPSPGPISTWGGFSGNGVLNWLTPYAGQGGVQVVDTRHNNPRVLASCAFTVLP